MVLAAYPLVKALASNPLIPASRIGGMAQVCSMNIALGSFYAACIIAQGATLYW